MSPSTSTACVFPLTLNGEGHRVLSSSASAPIRSVGIGAINSASDIDDGLGKGLRRFLWQVVPDAALDEPVLVSAGELLGVGARVRVWRAVGIALKRDGGHGNDREIEQAAFPDRRISSRLEPDRAANDSYGSRWRHGPGCRMTRRCDRT